MGTMESTKCTLCQIPFVPYNSEEIKSLNSNLVSSQMSAFYLVHTILNIPLNECSKYLEKYGNPSNWVTICPKCSVTLEEAQNLSRQLVQLKNRLGDLKELMTNQIRLKVEEEDFDEDDERRTMGAQAVANEIRQYLAYGRKNILGDALESFGEYEEDKEDNYLENIKSEVNDNSLVEPSSFEEDSLSIYFDYDVESESYFKSECTDEVRGYSSPEPSEHQTFSDSDESEPDQNLSDKFSQAETCDSDYRPGLETLISTKVGSEQLCIRKSARLSKSKKYSNRHNPEISKEKKTSKRISTKNRHKHVNSASKNQDGNSKRGSKTKITKRKISIKTTSKKSRNPGARPGLGFKVKKAPKGPVPSGSEPAGAESDFVSCNICHELFPNAKEVYEHKYTVHKYGVKCPDPSCVKVLSSPWCVEEHIRAFHRPKSIRFCSGCNTTIATADSSAYYNHLQENPDCKSKALSCSMCQIQFRFPTQEALNVHLEVRHTVTTVDAFPCPSCDKKFNDQYSLTNHETNRHAPKNFICEKCGKAFLTGPYLKKHYTTVHLNKEEGGEKFVCKTCERIFTNKFHLRRHEKLHGNEAPYLCTVCGKAYKVGNQLTTHMWSHDPDRYEKYSLYKYKSKPKAKEPLQKNPETESNISEHLNEYSIEIELPNSSEFS